jgi:CRP/FNR family transcriptional regulator, cyclic AMP receptor protein
VVTVEILGHNSRLCGIRVVATRHLARPCPSTPEHARTAWPDYGHGAMGESITLGEFVAKRGRKMNLRAGQVLFHEGDESKAVYACATGRVNLYITTPTGREVMLGSKVPVQAFGELSALDGGCRSASAVAMEASTIVQLTADEFLDELALAPHLTLHLLRVLAEHLRMSNARVSARSSENVTARVAHLLIELGEKFKRHGGTSRDIELPITQDELAAWVGSSREAVARSLGTLRRDGTVETRRNKIILLDAARLVAVASG